MKRGQLLHSIFFIANAFLAASPLLAASLTASNVQPIASLKTTVTRFLGQQLPEANGIRNDFEISAIDSRLRLAACAAELEAFLPPGQRLESNVTIGVRCVQPAWSLFVPVKLHRFADVLIAKRPLLANEIVSAADFETRQADLSSLSRGYFLANAQVTGYVVKHPVVAGAVLHGGMLSPPLFVKRGDRVAVIAATSGLEVRVFGVALADGMQGGRVAVRNISSNRVIQTIVTLPGTVEVQL